MNEVNIELYIPTSFIMEKIIEYIPDIRKEISHAINHIYGATTDNSIKAVVKVKTRQVLIEYFEKIVDEAMDEMCKSIKITKQGEKR